MCTVLDQQLLTSPDMFFSPASHVVINQVELIVHLLWRPKNSICLRRILWTFISACLWKWQTGMYFEVHIVHSNSEVPHSVTPGARFTEPVQIQSIQCQYLHWVCKPFVLCRTSKLGRVLNHNHLFTFMVDGVSTMWIIPRQRDNSTLREMLNCFPAYSQTTLYHQQQVVNLAWHRDWRQRETGCTTGTICWSGQWRPAALLSQWLPPVFLLRPGLWNILKEYENTLYMHKYTIHYIVSCIMSHNSLSIDDKSGYNL